MASHHACKLYILLTYKLWKFFSLTHWFSGLTEGPSDEENYESRKGSAIKSNVVIVEALQNTSESILQYTADSHQSCTDQQRNESRWERWVSPSWHHLHCTTNKQHFIDSHIVKTASKLSSLLCRSLTENSKNLEPCQPSAGISCGHTPKAGQQ